MKSSVRRTYKRVWVWFLTAPKHKTRAARTVVWFVPWVAMNAMVTFTLGVDLAFTFTSLLACASFWVLGWLDARRLNVRHEAQALAAYTGDHPDLTRFELEQTMRRQAATSR